MAAEGALEAPFDLRDVRDVIEMPVCEQKHFRLKPAGFQPLAGTVRRIEQNGAFWGVQEVTICLKNPSTKSFVFHVLVPVIVPPFFHESREMRVEIECSAIKGVLSSTSDAAAFP